MHLTYTELGNVKIRIRQTIEKRAFYKLIYLASLDKDLSDLEKKMANEFLKFLKPYPLIVNRVGLDKSPSIPNNKEKEEEDAEEYES